MLVSPPPLLLTVEEAARVLSVGRPKMWQLVMSGAVRSVKIGGSRRVPIAALEAFVERLSGLPGQALTEEEYDGTAR
jgi:excisionase family DNA binding protein